MPVTRKLTTICEGGETLRGDVRLSAGAGISFSEEIPAETTGLSIALTIDVSQLKMLFILANVDMTLTFEGPDNEMIVAAGEPISWHYLSQMVNPFEGVDVTSLTVDNPGDTDGLLQIELLVDPTL